MTDMIKSVNKLKTVQDQLKPILDRLEKINNADLLASGKLLLSELVTWDESMVQRKSTAYDDVENFPNKFTAEELIDSIIPPWLIVIMPSIAVSMIASNFWASSECLFK